MVGVAAFEARKNLPNIDDSVEKVLVSTTEGFLLNKLLNKNEKFRSGSFRQSPFYKSLDVNQGSGLRIYKRENPSSGNYYTE